MRLAIAKSRAKRALARGLDYFGYYPVRSMLADLRAETDDPVAASYLAPGRAFLINVPLERCRSRKFHLRPDSRHPFVGYAKEIASGIRRVEDSSLIRYYAHASRPHSAAELLGLKDAPELEKLTSSAVVQSWEHRKHLKLKERRRHVPVDN